MDHGIDEKDLLIKVGAAHALDIDALCTDVAAVIFPTSAVPVSEATISAVSGKLIQLVADLEARLRLKMSGDPPITWKFLAKSGFLRSADLIDFTLARVAEDRLDACIAQDRVELPSHYLDHPNDIVADASQSLLAAESLHRSGAGSTYLALPPELLYKFTWQVVAAIEAVKCEFQPEAVICAKSIISRYSEADRAQDAARKIVHFVGELEQSKLLDPQTAGLQLHVAWLSATLDLDHDHVLRLVNAASSAPYAVMLAANGVLKEQALRNIFLFRGDLISTREAGLFESGYQNLDKSEAASEVSCWGSARGQYLSSGKSG